MERERRSLSPQLGKATLKVDSLNQPGVGSGENPFLCRRNGGLLRWTLQQDRGRYALPKHLLTLHRDTAPWLASVIVKATVKVWCLMVAHTRYQEPSSLFVENRFHIVSCPHNRKAATGTLVGTFRSVLRGCTEGFSQGHLGGQRSGLEASLWCSQRPLSLYSIPHMSLLHRKVKRRMQMLWTMTLAARKPAPSCGMTRQTPPRPRSLLPGPGGPSPWGAAPSLSAGCLWKGRGGAGECRPPPALRAATRARQPARTRTRDR